MPVEERENAVSFYEEMFNEAGEDKAAAVIADLGSPVDLARAILCDNSDYSRSIKNATASQRLFVENCRRTILGGNSQLTADVILYKFTEKFVIFIFDKVIKTDSAADKHLFNALEISQLSQNIKVFRV